MNNIINKCKIDGWGVGLGRKRKQANFMIALKRKLIFFKETQFQSNYMMA